MFKPRLWLIPLALLGVLAVIIGSLWLTTRNSVPAPTTTAAEFGALPEGATVSFVGQIVAQADAEFTLEMLTGEQFTQRTGLFLHINVASVTEVQRGSWPAVAPEALVQVVGVKTGPESVWAERLVIYTGFVAGPP